MTFLSPGLAAFALLAAVPVIIHLLNRRNFRIVPWGAMEFLLRSATKSRRRLQLQDLLLLLLRVAALVLVALACARPLLPSGKLADLGGSPGTTVIVLDNSLSMAVADGGASRFATAKTKALAVIRSLAPGAKAALVLLSDLAESPLAEPSTDLGLVAGLIEQARQGSGGTSVPGALIKAAALVHANGIPGGEIVVISDGQAAGWPAPEDPAWTAVRRDLHGCRLLVCDVGGPTPGNAACTDLVAEDSVVTAGGDGVLVATVVRRGLGTGPLPVELWADDGRGGDLRKVAIAGIPAGEGRASVRLVHRFPSGGQYRLEVRLPPDALVGDNSRGLVLEVVDRVPVGIVAQGPAGHFLKAALEAAGRTNADASGETFAVTLVHPDRLADLNLDEQKAVIIAGLADPSRVATSLGSAIGDGRGLILLPGSASDPAAWNQALEPLLPATLSARPVALGDGPAAFQTFASDHLDHPVAVFFAPPEQQTWLTQPRFRQAWGLSPVAGAATILRLSGGQPWLVERPFGRGLVALAGEAADKTWSDLPLRPAFVMLLRRLVQHVALGTPPRRNLPVHAPLVLGVPPREAQQRFTVTRPDGTTATATPVPASGGRWQIDIPNVDAVGFWGLGRSGGTTTWFAVSPPADESDLTRAASTALAPCLAPVPTVWVGPGEDLLAHLQRARDGLPAWPWLLALAAGCLLGETLLLVRGARR